MSKHMFDKTPEEVAGAWPNTEQDMRALGIAIKACCPELYKWFSGTATPADPVSAVTEMLIDLSGVSVRVDGRMWKVAPESIAKIAWFGVAGEHFKRLGWQWLCLKLDEVIEARGGNCMCHRINTGRCRIYPDGSAPTRKDLERRYGYVEVFSHDH